MTRRFGPVRGAGVAVVEKSGTPSIEASAMGVAAIVAQFERGPVNKTAAPAMTICPTRAAFDAKMGGRIAGSTGPDVAQDYWDHGEGAGALVAVRVTDGNEITPYVDLYSRGWGTDFYASTADKGGQAQIKNAVLRVHAANAGRWGGAGRLFSKAFDPADLAETSVKFDATFVEDEWIGATLILTGVEFRRYEVVSNETDGTVHVKADATMLSDLGASTDYGALLALGNTTLKSGNLRGLGVRVREAEVDPAVNFALEVYLDGALVKTFPTLSMDPASPYYVVPMINDDKGNDWITVEDLIPAGTGIVPDHRPANYYGRPRSVQARRIEFNTAQVVANTAPTKIKIVDARFLPAAAQFLAAGFLPAFRVRGVWDATAHSYTMTATQIGGKSYADGEAPAISMSSWAVGGGAQYHKTFEDVLFSITLDHNSEPSTADYFEIEFHPIDSLQAEGAVLVPDSAAPYRKFRIASADYEAIEIDSGDLVGDRTAPTLARVQGSIDGPFAIVASTNDDLKVSFDGLDVLGLSELVVTLTAGAARTATQIAGEINAAIDAAVGVAGAYVGAEVSTDGKRLILKSQGWKGAGPRSTVEVHSLATSAAATLGLAETETTGAIAATPAPADIIGTKASTFLIAAGTNDALKFEVDGRAQVSITLTAGAARTAAQIVGEINAAFDALFGAGNLNPATVYDDGTDKFVRLTSPGYEGGGPGSSIKFVGVAHNAGATLGLPGPDAGDDVEVQGTISAEACLSYGSTPTGGHDGGTPTDQDYLDALAISASPLNRLAGKGMGVVQITAPDALSPIVIKAGVNFAEARNYVYLVPVPADILDEQDAADYVNEIVGRSMFSFYYFPTFVRVLDPDGVGALKTIPVHGMTMGRDALFARRFGGYHRPAAGVDATLPRIVDTPIGDAALNEEILNPVGLNVIKRVGGNWVVWGARTASRTSETEFKFKPHRLQLSHYEWTVLENYDWIIFAVNDPTLRAALISQFREFFAKEWAKDPSPLRKFNAKGAPGNLDDALTIKIDGENNPPEAEADGDLNAALDIGLANIVERFVVTVSKRGLFESTSA